MNGHDGLAYSADAKQRIHELGYENVHAFMLEVPTKPLFSIVLAQKHIGGFRPNSKPEAEEQVRRLGRRLTSTEAKAASVRDWLLFKHIWLAWNRHRCNDTDYLQTLMEFDQRESPIDDGAVSQIRECYRALALAHSVSREDLDRLLLFSPFPDVGEFTDAVALATSKEEHEREVLLKALVLRVEKLETNASAQSATSPGAAGQPEDVERIAKISAQVDQVVQDLAALRAKAEAASTVSVTAEHPARAGPDVLGLVEKAITRSDHAVAAASASAEHVATVGSSLRESLADLRTEVHEITSSVDGLLARIVILEERRAELPSSPERSVADKTSRPERDNGGPHVCVSDIVIAGSRDELRALSETAVLADILHDRGLADESAKSTASEILASIAAGQIVSMSGSLAELLTTIVTSAVAAEWDAISMPIGVGSDLELTSWLKSAPAGRSLVILGANRSAFELYGRPIRTEIEAAQFCNDPPRHFYLASIVGGPGGLPLISSYCELGPIIDTDSLAWRSARSTSNDRGVILNVETLGSDGARLHASNLEPQLDIALDALKLMPTRLAHRAMVRALRRLEECYGEDDENAILTSLLAGWVLPYARVRGRGSKEITEVLADTAFANALTAPRVRRVLGAH